MNLLNTLNTINDVHLEIKNMRDKLLQDALADISLFVQKRGVKLAVGVRGYTPYFNDGDVCEHSQEVIFDDSSFNEDVNNIYDIQRYQLECYTDDEIGSIEEIFFKLEKEIALSSKYGTNFELLYLFDIDGSMDRYETSYDCGW